MNEPDPGAASVVADRSGPTLGVRVEYQQLYRVGRQPVRAWSLLGFLVVATCFFVVNAATVVVAFAAVMLARGTPADQLEDELRSLADTGDTTPASLLFVHLVLIMAIPQVLLVVRWVHRIGPGWLMSVTGKVRWRWAAASFGVAIGTFVVTILLGTLLPSTSDGDLIGADPNDFGTEALQFLLIIVLLTPLQALSEEFVFRGYLTQAFGSVASRVWVSRVVAIGTPALLFALAHGAQDLPIFIDRLAFGLSAGILIVATGGLEAGIAYHVVNNLLAFGLTLALGDMSGVLDPQGGTSWDALLSIMKSVIFVVASIACFRMMRLSRVAPDQLDAARPRQADRRVGTQAA